MTEHCTDCSRPMIRSHRPGPPGTVCHSAYGRCKRCDDRFRRKAAAVACRVVDEIAVWRACQGDPVTLRVDERRQAAAILTARGMSARLIAERLRCTPRTVVRYRHLLAVAA